MSACEEDIDFVSEDEGEEEGEEDGILLGWAIADDGVLLLLVPVSVLLDLPGVDLPGVDLPGVDLLRRRRVGVPL